MELDVVFLSRVQFALTIMFHYLFPPLTIGMGVVLVYLEGMFLRTKEPVYEQAARFWTSLFAVTFAVGVATGIVMEFQFGTNWADYSRFVGDVFGSALAAEGIFAFFLESGFLAVLVFGWDKVSPRVHFLSTVMVAAGSMFSAVWIVAANSWQQTPQGHHIVPVIRDGEPWVLNGRTVVRAEIVDFWAVVFNPSFLNRITHVWIGAFVLGAFFIMSISAWYILQRKHEDFAKRSFAGALVLGLLASIAAAVSGDLNAKMVARQQPAKFAAIEGHFETGPLDMLLFGVPDTERGETTGKIGVPGLGSWLLTGHADSDVMGLDKVRPEHHPPVAISFYSFHIMVALGGYMLLLTALAAILHWRGVLFEQRWLMWVFVVSIAAPYVANQLGWVTAEVGRQPWIVHPRTLEAPGGGFALDADGFLAYRLEEGLMTKNAVSQSISGEQVLTSIIMFSLIYILLFWLWVFVLNKKIHAGPQPLPDRRSGGRWRGVAGTRALHEDTMAGRGA